VVAGEGVGLVDEQLRGSLEDVGNADDAAEFFGE